MKLLISIEVEFEVRIAVKSVNVTVVSLFQE